MTRLRRDLAAGVDDGVSLVELVVSLLIFGLLSTGIVAGMLTIVRMTDDNRARVAASGLAAQDIALARAIGDPFALADKPTITTTVTVGSRTYTVVRSSALVSSTGADATCASSDIFYARVNVKVSWPGKLATTPVVQDDTIVASQGRINDAATGSVTVSVIGADGTPRPGIEVRVTPTSGGAVLAAQPADTDADGCTRALDVMPGTYRVTLTESGYKGIQQEPNPSKTVIVIAGANQALSFQYDQAAIFRTAYIPWPVAYSTSTPLLPTNLDTTFVNSTSGAYTTTAPAASVALHPFPSGYQAIAGTPSDSSGSTTCAANDPRSWSASSSNGPNMATGVTASAAAAAGQTTDFRTVYGSTASTGIPMGVVEVRGLSSLVPAVLTATTTTPPAGSANPGCTTTRTYTFSGLLSLTRTALLLPYGSYTISQGGLPVTASSLTVPTNAAGGGVTSTGLLTAAVVTLDPRPRS